MNIDSIYKTLKKHLKNEVEKNSLKDETITVTCNALTAEQAIGTPECQDYPIIKGKEVMVEANFKGAKGQAFTDDFKNISYTLSKLLLLTLDSNKNRSIFIASLNAVYRYLNLCDKTIHCKDLEPGICAKELCSFLDTSKNIAQIGYQPGFIKQLSQKHKIRVIDLNSENIGTNYCGISIEPPENTEEILNWSDIVFVTGSTVVNGTFSDFLNYEKPVIFYGVTIAAVAKILNLNTYCHCSS